MQEEDLGKLRYGILDKNKTISCFPKEAGILRDESVNIIFLTWSFRQEWKIVVKPLILVGPRIRTK